MSLPIVLNLHVVRKLFMKERKILKRELDHPFVYYALHGLSRAEHICESSAMPQRIIFLEDSVPYETWKSAKLYHAIKMALAALAHGDRKKGIALLSDAKRDAEGNKKGGNDL